MAWASRGALLRAANGISGGACRRSLAVSVPALRRSSRSNSSPTTTGYDHAAVPTCLKSDRRSHRRPLSSIINPIQRGLSSPGDGILSPPGITIGTNTSRCMSSSAPQYFEGPWYEKYLLLEQYKKEHGNCIVPNSFVYDDVKLGNGFMNSENHTRREHFRPIGARCWMPSGSAGTPREICGRGILLCWNNSKRERAIATPRGPIKRTELALEVGWATKERR